MVVVPLSKAADDPENSAGATPCTALDKHSETIRYAAAAALVASGALLLTGNRRAGLLAAAAGTALTMLDQQEVLRVWWNALPIYLEEAQRLVGRVQGAIEDVAAQREKLRNVTAR